MSEENRLDLRRIGIGFGLLGLVLGIVGAIFTAIEVDYEFGCEDIEFIQEKYSLTDVVSEENVRECIDDWKSSKTMASFLNAISPVFILSGILLLVYAKGTKK